MNAYSKKIQYVTNARIPTEKANGIQIMKMCEAFASAGCKVELFVPRRKNAIADNPFEYYGVENIFKITYGWTLDIRLLGFFRFYLQLLTFLLSVVRQGVSNANGVIFTRTPHIAYLLSMLGEEVVFELHTTNSRWISILASKKARVVVAISSGLKEYLVKHGVAEEKIVVAHDGVDIEQFAAMESQDELREQLRLPLGASIVAYVGKATSMGKGKGVEGIIQAVADLSKKDRKVHLLLVGINEDEMDFITSQIKSSGLPKGSCTVVGHVSHSLVSQYLHAADVLALNYAKGANFHSPLKLFEYMASKRPIVSTRVESVVEVLNDSNAYLVEEGDVKAYANAIEGALKDVNKSSAIAKKAYEDVLGYTWGARVQKILKKIGHE
jgi:glycosyltransferase involved in cell wall biosynthesis